MGYHIMAFIAGFLIDLLVGDPYFLPHPIRLIGRLIHGLEIRFIGTKKQSRVSEGKYRQDGWKGICLVLLVTLVTVSVTAAVLAGSYLVHPYIGCLVETVMTYQILAMKDLRVESMKVYHCLQRGTLQEAREAVSMIVGRDTASLDEIGVAKAAIETVAENTSDGVIAPMIYTALGGPVLGFLYKAVNTMDSMVGYKNERYLYFGRAAARLDDVLNYIPSRISAMLMITACLFLGEDFSTKDAWKIHRRDGRKHASPNSAQTESVCAGALGIQLAGNASYFGKVVEKPYIGDYRRAVETEDIKRSNKLMYATAFLSETILGVLLCMVEIFIATR